MVRDIFVSVMSGLILLVINSKFKKFNTKKKSDSSRNQTEDK